MAISTLDRQLLLIQQIGDVDPATADPVSPLLPGSSGIVLINAERLWQMHEAKLTLPYLGSAIFDYYFKRDGVSLVIAILEARVDFSAVGTAMSVKLNQRIAARQMQTERFKAEIVRLETRLASLAPGVAVPLAAKELFPPPVVGQSSSPMGVTWTVDANDYRYAGSPYFRTTLDPSFRR